MINLVPMSKEEFKSYLNQFRSRIIKDAVRAFGITEVEAERIADKDLSEIDKFENTNNCTFTLINDLGKKVGMAWLFFRGEGERKTPYLNDLFIEPQFRGQGIGKQALALLEGNLKSQGIRNNMAVHVIGDFNENAIRLFKSSGYFVTAIMMEKKIDS